VVERARVDYPVRHRQRGSDRHGAERVGEVARDC
jgi:hypothetical protein